MLVRRTIICTQFKNYMAVNMHGKRSRFFVITAGLILFLTGTAKLVDAFLKEMGKSPKVWLMEQRLQNAKKCWKMA